MTWRSLQGCWADALFLPSLAHRLWRLTLQILARFSVFVHEVRPAAGGRAWVGCVGFQQATLAREAGWGGRGSLRSAPRFPSRFPFTLAGIASRGLHGARLARGRIGKPHADALTFPSQSQSWQGACEVKQRF